MWPLPPVDAKGKGLPTRLQANSARIDCADLPISPAEESFRVTGLLSDDPTSKAVTGRFGLTGPTDFVVTYKTTAFSRQLDGRTRISERWPTSGP
jgi:hypothetical protein